MPSPAREGVRLPGLRGMELEGAISPGAPSSSLGKPQESHPCSARAQLRGQAGSALRPHTPAPGRCLDKGEAPAFHLRVGCHVFALFLGAVIASEAVRWEKLERTSLPGPVW